MASVAHAAKAPFIPSAHQQKLFTWGKSGRGHAILKAVAGSGKSTSIVQLIPYLQPAHLSFPTSVLILGFNRTTAEDMAEKVSDLMETTSMPIFPRVRVKTFHGLGYGMLLRHFNVSGDAVKINGAKIRQLASREWTKEFSTLATEEDRNAALEKREDMYLSFVDDLIGFIKGEGLGTRLGRLTDDAMLDLIDHYGLYLSSEEATVEEAMRLTREILAASNAVAKDELWLDYNDQLYLPILWNLAGYQYQWVIVDEGQDTNPVRREFVRMFLKPKWGRLLVVGDPKQSIYGFTGASVDALDQIKKQFNAIELPLTVSYRCPLVAQELVGGLVPYFQTHPNNKKGRISHLPVKEAIAHLTQQDAILCRNTKPLVRLAYRLWNLNVPCVVLGSNIGAQLEQLIRKMRAKDLDGLKKKLTAWATREVSAATKAKDPKAAEAVQDKVECLYVFIDNLDENSRTIAKLIARIRAMFTTQDQENKKSLNILTLSTIHKAKGREWNTVAILEPELSPSQNVHQEWEHEQELNLIYVRDTRFKDHYIVLTNDNDEEDNQQKKEAA
jgi:superfamily I DNA/RNA helicase